MKKIRLVVISIISFITFNIGLSSCTNETSIQGPSTVTATVEPTQPSSSPSEDSIDSIDYNQYIKKVWVVKSWSKGPYDNSSFWISKIANGEIKGRFLAGTNIKPDERVFLSDSNIGNLSGTINNGIAECKFRDRYANVANVKLVFKTNNEIEVTIKFVNKSQIYKFISPDGTFLFRPYNLKDIDGFTPFKDQCFTVDLNLWGDVKFMSGKLIGGRHIPTVAYLTNKEEDILYDFTSFIPNNVEFNAVSFNDINNDGLKDIIIIYGVEKDISSQLARVFFQKQDGYFYFDEELNIEIDKSVKNKDIKTITDYLSEKY